MTGKLKFGLTSLHSGEGAYPEKMIHIAQAAEKAGFESIWAGGHPFLSEKQSRFPSSLRMLDPIVTLSFVAAQTRSLRLGTGILLLPQFNPVILAKQLASLDVLSGGRLIVGIGVGWSEHEYEVLGVSYHDRGRRADEYLKAIKAIWTEDHPVYKGKFVSFDSMQSFPHPIQQPYPPIVVGGNSPGAFRRAVEVGKGWFGYGLDLQETTAALSGLREATKKYSRPPELGELEISVVPKNPVNNEAAEQFSKAGIRRLILIPPWNKGLSGVDQFLQNVGDSLIGKV